MTSTLSSVSNAASSMFDHARSAAPQQAGLAEVLARMEALIDFRFQPAGAR
jgi:hypothetical protein